MKKKRLEKTSCKNLLKKKRFDLTDDYNWTSLFARLNVELRDVVLRQEIEKFFVFLYKVVPQLLKVVFRGINDAFI